MKYLNQVLESKTLEDLKAPEVKYGSNLIEPTTVMIEQAISMLKEGKGYSEIRKTVKKDGTKLSMSKGQIKTIHNAMRSKIAELTPETKEE